MGLLRGFLGARRADRLDIRPTRSPRPTGLDGTGDALLAPYRAGRVGGRRVGRRAALAGRGLASSGAAVAGVAPGVDRGGRVRARVAPNQAVNGSRR